MTDIAPAVASLLAAMGVGGILLELSKRVLDKMSGRGRNRRDEVQRAWGHADREAMKRRIAEEYASRPDPPPNRSPLHRHHLDRTIPHLPTEGVLMDITLPTLPAGMLVLLGLFAPYAIGALNGVLPFIRRPWQKKTLSIGVAVLLAAVILVGYYAHTGDILPDWPVLVLLAIVVVQASYALVTKTTATTIETAVEDYFTPGETLHLDHR